MKRSIRTKTLCAILSLLLILQLTPLASFAEENELTETTVPISETNEATQGTSEIVCELYDKRSEYTKEFLLNDGSYYSVTTTYPMHVMNNGAWENSSQVLDNTDDAQTTDEIKTTLQSAAYDVMTANEEETAVTLNTLNEDDVSETETTSDTIGIKNHDYENNSDGTSIVFHPIHGVTLSTYSSDQIPDVYEYSNADGAMQVTISSLSSYIDNNKVIKSAKLSFSRHSEDKYYSDGSPVAADLMFYEGIAGLVKSEATLDIVRDLVLIDELNVSTFGNFEIDITDVLNKWDIGVLENNGIVIRALMEEIFYVTLYSFTFEVYYEEVDKNDIDFTYHNIDMGNAGVAYINNYTNSLWVQNSLFSIDSNVLPITLSRVIDGNNPITSNLAGYGFSWNIESTININLSLNDYDIYNGYTAVWNTFNGESVLFVSDESPSLEGEYQVWHQFEKGNIQDNTSINLYILETEIENNNINYANVYIKQGDTTYNFNASGQVVSIKRPSSNNSQAEVSITYGPISETNTTTCLKQLTTEDGITYEFTYANTPIRRFYLTQIDIEELSTTTIISTQKETSDIQSSTDYDVINTVSFSSDENIKYIFGSDGKLFRVINSKNECWEFEYVSINEISKNRILSYSKINIDDNGNEEVEYTVQFKVPNGYYREIKKTNGETNSTETIQYNRDHQIVTHKDFNGKFICVEYDDNGIVKSFAFDENADGNLVTDSSFEVADIGTCNSWTLNENAAETVVSTFADQSHGNYELKILPTTEKELKISQTVSGTFKANNTYVIGAWVKVNNTLPINDKKIGIEVKDLSGNAITFISFDNTLDQEWQYRLQAFTLTSQQTGLVIDLTALNQSGEIHFDEVTLFEAVDSQADLNNIVTSSPIISSYNEDGTISSETMTDGVNSMRQSYVYDSNGNIIETKNINGLTEYRQYSSVGEWIGTIKNNDGEIEDATQFIYDSSGVLQTVSKTIHSVVSGADESISTVYGTENDEISSVYHNGFEYLFEYNSDGTLASIDVSPKEDTDESTLIEYGYTGDSYVGYIAYKNGYEVDYTYDSDGNIILIECLEIDNDTDETTVLKSYEYIYKNGNLVSSHDTGTGYTIVYSNNGYSLNTVRNGETDSIELYNKVLNESDESVETFRQAYFTDTNNTSFDTITTSKDTVSTESSDGSTTNSSSVFVNKNASDNKLSTMNYSRASITDYFNRITNKNTVLEYNTGNGKTYNVVSDTNYEYKLLDIGVTSGLISSYTTSVCGDNAVSGAELTEYKSYSRKYDYDHKGNLIYVYTESGTTLTPKEYYEYDEANQMVTSINFQTGKVMRFTYDAGGNLTAKIHYTYSNLQFDAANKTISDLGAIDYTETYSYDSILKDSMICYTKTDYTETEEGITETSKVETEITYDNMGNPLNYIGIDIDNASVTGDLEWEGNLLSAFENTKIRIEYEYDSNGYRSTKTVYDKETDDNGNTVLDIMYKMTYIWDNGILTNLLYAGGDCEELSLNIIYDQEGAPVGYITSMGLPYYFIKDVNENVLGLVHADGTELCSITYDAWGKPSFSYYGDNLLLKLVSKATAVFCPITYHGYIYDYETGMYCSQGRCYSPAWGRYINPENPTSLIEYSTDVLDANLYLFCNNNPINNIDPYASWSRNYIQPNWISRGFSVNMNEVFASRSFCTIFTNQFLKTYGVWDAENGYTYLGMDAMRISSNLFAHYIGKNASSAIEKVNTSWGEGWIEICKQSNSISIKTNDKNAWKYEKIWYAAPELKPYAWSQGIYITL